MAINSKIIPVKTVHASNVDADEDTKTLWIFGAGASRHLDFPLSFDLFQRSVGLCTEKMKTFSDSEDLRYSVFSQYYRDAGQPVPTRAEIAEFADNPRLALEYLHVWDYLKPDAADFVRIQYLFGLWCKVLQTLHSIGMTLSPQELLAAYPEELINRVRATEPANLVNNGLAYDDEVAVHRIKEAQDVLQRIYFWTLSLFNDMARETTRQFPTRSLYAKLVRSFIFDKNARVITFNYDTMLDEAIFTNFTRSWKYGGINIAGINGCPVTVDSSTDLLVIKPHGSLHYLRCGNCGRVHVNWFWAYGETGPNTLSSGNRRCVQCTEPVPGRRELMSSLTVEPLYDKKIIEKSFDAIGESMQWADLVVSVGYSFPDQDNYVYKLMCEAINKRTGSPLTINVVSNSPEGSREIAERLNSGLQAEGVMEGRVKVVGMEFNGFEAVEAGSKNVQVN